MNNIKIQEFNDNILGRFERIDDIQSEQDKSNEERTREIGDFCIKDWFLVPYCENDTRSWG